MKYIVYLTTNTKSSINGVSRIYVGVHKTSDPGIFDGYLGSGCNVSMPSTYMYPKTPFQCAVKKYGVEAFKRSILYIFDTVEEAYRMEAIIVNKDFINQPHTYNVDLGGTQNSEYVTKTLYQFDLNGTLKKKWQYYVDASEFYGIPVQRFKYAVTNKYSYLNSYWSTSKQINIKEFRDTNEGRVPVIYLYTIDGKCMMEFPTKKEVSEYLGISIVAVNTAIKNQRIVHNKWYVSDRLVDEFIPKPRAQYLKTEFFVYKETGEFIGSYIGKKLMPIINLHSWSKIKDFMQDGKGWYKTFYISEKEINKLPERHEWHRITVDVYDRWGNYKETTGLKELKEKYEVPSCKIKNIQKGDKYFKDWIFKYHSA